MKTNRSKATPTMAVGLFVWSFGAFFYLFRFLPPGSASGDHRRVDAGFSNQRFSVRQPFCILFLQLCGDADTNRYSGRPLGTSPIAYLGCNDSIHWSCDVRIGIRNQLGLGGQISNRRGRCGCFCGTAKSGYLLVFAEPFRPDLRISSFFRDHRSRLCRHPDAHIG